MPELILISKGKEYKCLYDQMDHDRIISFSWYLQNGYAATYINGERVLMQRFILGLNDSKIIADHRDGNKINNCRSNLRAATHSENRRNSRKEKNCTSIYKGAYFEKERGLFHAQIGFATETRTKVFNLGRYSDSRIAGKAYDRKAIELFGSFACINFTSSREASQLTFPWI